MADEQVRFRAVSASTSEADDGTAGAARRLTLVGSIPELGFWLLGKGVTLHQEKTGDGRLTSSWVSEPISIPKDRFPFKYRYAANGHRQSPTTRPLIWDRASRLILERPSSGVVEDRFEPTPETSDSGWVTTSGVGAYQLRVGQPPGSSEPLVTLSSGVREEFRVQLYEATPGDPNVPQGKPFASLSAGELGLPHQGPRLSLGGQPSSSQVPQDSVTFLLNAQSLAALAFRVDVTAKGDGRLLARGFISHHTLASLQGSISAVLVDPDLKQVGLFKAGFLVVTALDHPKNSLTDLQRTRWSPAAASSLGTLDIGHRGSGASVGRDGRSRSVRENTVLSFQKAATNTADFIEFDVHVTSNGVVVVHHDFDVSLAVGRETISLGIPTLTYAQLSSSDFTHAMVGRSEHGMMLEGQMRLNQRIMKRNLSSAEDMLRSNMKPSLMSTSPTSPSHKVETPWRIADRIATLREAFQRTPAWLGFNIELKYPTEAELAAMPTRFYSRNYFCDAILKVVLEEAGHRRVIFSTFDPDCATLLSLKQPRFPVFFLTCAGAKQFPDPRMNSVEAAFLFAKTSQLQGVVAEATLIMHRLKDLVEDFHKYGLFLFTWGDVNNNWENYSAQKADGVDGIILDDVARISKASGKQCSLFQRPLSSPASYDDVLLADAYLPSMRSLGMGDDGVPCQTLKEAAEKPQPAGIANGATLPMEIGRGGLQAIPETARV